MIMCDYCALSPAQRKSLRETFRLLLNPGGSVLLDVHSLHDFRRKEERAVLEESRADGFWSADKYYCFRNAFLYGEEKVSLDKYTIVEKDRVRTASGISTTGCSISPRKAAPENSSRTDGRSGVTWRMSPAMRSTPAAGSLR
jgi:hypothetical protein